MDTDSIQPPCELVLRPPQDGVVEVEVRPVEGAFPRQLQEMAQPAEGLTMEEEEQLQQLLERWKGVFARDDEDHGQTDTVHHPHGKCSAHQGALPARSPQFVFGTEGSVEDHAHQWRGEGECEPVGGARRFGQE